jgi:hypothetical protein
MFVIAIPVQWGEAISIRNMVMKRWFILVAISIGVVARSGAVELSASVDSNVVSMDDRVILSVSVAGAMGAGEPVIPPMDGLRVTNKSHSTQIQVVNGHLSMSGQYDYTLVPLRVGKMTIPPIVLTYKNKAYKTEPITVEVKEDRAAVKAASTVKKADAPEPARQDAAAGKKMFIELSIDKPEVYLREQITLTFRFYCSGGLAEQPVYEPPPAPGFVVKLLGDGKSENYTQVLGGRQYQVSELKTALYPYQTGELTVGPARLKGSLLVESGRRRVPRRGVFNMDDFFNDPFFGRFETRPFELVSNQLKVRVQPLPSEGAPAGEVAVGRYTLKVEAKPKEVHVGDPITLTMTVSGEGDLERVPPPQVSELTGFKSYEATSSTESGGVKKFELAIVPLDEDIKEIPRITFNCFDPSDKKYLTLSGGPIPIKVLPPREEHAAKIVSGTASAGKKGVKLLERNIVFIKTAPGTLARGGDNGMPSVGFWIVQCLPLLLILAAFFHSRHRVRLSSDSGYARLYGAGRMTKSRLASAERVLKDDNAEEFYGALVRAINMYVADRLNIPAGGLTPDIIQEKLAERHASSGLIERIDGFLHSCDLARFASGEATRSDMERAYREATEILEGLRKCRL